MKHLQRRTSGHAAARASWSRRMPAGKSLSTTSRFRSQTTSSTNSRNGSKDTKKRSQQQRLVTRSRERREKPPPLLHRDPARKPRVLLQRKQLVHHLRRETSAASPGVDEQITEIRDRHVRVAPVRSQIVGDSSEQTYQLPWLNFVRELERPLQSPRQRYVDWLGLAALALLRLVARSIGA